MPLTSVLADALGVVTISLVAVLGLLGLLCIVYLLYFRDHIRSQSRNQLRYFSGPWVVRIVFILFAIWWGLGEILRLEFLRRDGRVLHSLDSEWQETVCKCYIVSNLGFSEPCLFLTLVYLLRASLQKAESGPLSRKWNFRTVIYILLCVLPLFALQMTVILVGPRFETDLHLNENGYLFKITNEHPNDDDVALCYYPLLSTIFLDSLALKNLQDLEATRRIIGEHNDTLSLIANHGPIDDFTTTSGRNSSTKRGSISFRATERDEQHVDQSMFVELSLFSPSQHSTPAGSPRLHGWPMVS
ncbi:hypothetical protein M8C21_014786 [Ambrosia artemisiifolia]|uniref:Uncharacterized protein n=1 Tax=Ambrosia artemisiifolia TaxID=4212 RepID=A0AAD5BXW4_AMBAR|nr:hypothetical protein M8C21_014786 [Ambrosia artemisiifolia]